MSVTSLDLQLDAYVAAGYPELAGLTEAAFRERFAPLRDIAAKHDDTAEPAAGTLGYLAVVSDRLIDPAARVTHLRLPGSTREGILDRNHVDEGLSPYRARPHLGVPDAEVYLLIGIERGDDYRDVAPLDTRDALTARRHAADHRGGPITGDREPRISRQKSLLHARRLDQGR